ncbi:MICOS complex subunit MIC19-like [Xenentodon cancila]
MQKSLEDEMNQKKQELQQQLDELKVQAEAEASAAARAQVEVQVKETLEAEREAYMEKLTESITKERMKTDDERLLVQLYWMELKLPAALMSSNVNLTQARQLEVKEKELKERDALHQEQVAKIEARCAEFYRASAENFRKGKEETHNRFARFNIQPVCGDLQDQILKCYKENTGKTLTCSGIASAYMQCVDNAKKNKLTTGG